MQADSVPLMTIYLKGNIFASIKLIVELTKFVEEAVLAQWLHSLLTIISQLELKIVLTNGLFVHIKHRVVWSVAAGYILPVVVYSRDISHSTVFHFEIQLFMKC